jgi:hypothetical protein
MSDAPTVSEVEAGSVVMEMVALVEVEVELASVEEAIPVGEQF